MKKTVTIFILLFLLSCKGEKKDEEKNTKKEKASQTEVLNKIGNTHTENLIQLIKIDCNGHNSGLSGYNLDCKSFNVSNTIVEGSDENRYELISFAFNDIQKAIIRKINNEDLETSAPIVYSSLDPENYVIFFPINGEYHFGWKLYLYKKKVLYPIGQRVLYWNPKYEESDIEYSKILKIYESNTNITVEVPCKYVVKNDKDYKNYPNYSDGKFYEKDDNLYYEFSTSKIHYYKKYKDGLFEGDYNKMINNKIIDGF